LRSVSDTFIVIHTIKTSSCFVQIALPVKKIRGCERIVNSEEDRQAYMVHRGVKGLKNYMDRRIVRILLYASWSK
jgi:hypothetical protein